MILPKPQQLERLDGAFQLTSSATVRADESSAQVAQALRRALAPATGFALDDASGDETAAITLRVDPSLVGPEAYRLTVTPEGVEIAGSDPSGVFYGVQSLRQLLPAEIFSATTVERQWEAPAVAVADRPRFGWRGTMLDVARHFMPKEFVLKLIDLLALHKLNVFHFHLTEDQGWRLASEKYPRLAEIGAYRPETLVGHAHRPESEFTFDGTPHGGYYTQDDIREIVAYAQERFITVIPEIDMPGHMLAAITAYPELGNGLKPAEVWTRWGISEQVLNVEDSTLDFCRDILDEVMSLFPSPLIHLRWRRVPEGGVAGQPGRAGTHEVARPRRRERPAGVVHHAAGRPRRRPGAPVVGWDEVLEGGGPANLPNDVVVMSWRSEEGGIEAARGGLDVVMAPCQTVYFDYYQSEDTDAEPLAIGGFVPLEKVYDYRPIPGELDAEAARHVLGAQCQLWTEYVPTPEHAEYMLFPRVCAFAEAVWRDETGGVEDYAAFLDRLRPHLARLDAVGVNYRKLD